MNRQALEQQARKCQKTWGMGFPVISMTLLEPYLQEYEAELAALRERVGELEEALRQVEYSAEYGGMRCCPSCGAFKWDNGHDPECVYTRLALASKTNA